ncbi:hypothetical protein [Xanthocytophaga agilis]|uniref:Calx-beta domain-containing protein n=1 Tax=Xanthocytophaga agilis TaxID=3048010 RepID=A0AAE3UJM7_9BACT|nr:hypothetical protein [Xanthocytophaga agilis]MDJ1505413.1 hypothetical protein [Xanthocytophaga agilis]
MKTKLLTLGLFFLTLSCLGQLTIGFVKTEIVEEEGTDEKQLTVDLKLEGKWNNKDEFKIKLTTSGDATKGDGYDYVIKPDNSEFTISKSNVFNLSFTITILPDRKIEDLEEIILTIKLDESVETDFVKVDTAKNILKITIKDYKSFQDEILRRINTDKDTSEVIGHISLRKNTVHVYKLKLSDKGFESAANKIDPEEEGKGKWIGSVAPTEVEKTGIFNETQQIQSVELYFRDGVVSEIKVYTIDEKTNEKEVFTNTFTKVFRNGRWIKRNRIPVSLRHADYKKYLETLRLYANLNDKTKFIRIGDIINYDPQIGKNYPPSDGYITLNNETKTKPVIVNTSLNSYINLNVYTDFLSLVKAERGNGLVQTEASAHILLNTKNHKYKPFFFVNFLEPSLKFSRFDNGFSSVVPDTIDKDLNKISINRMYLNQRSYLNTSIRLNLFRKIYRFYSELELNTLVGFNWANVRG